MDNNLKPIVSKIIFLRGKQVILDEDIARLYQVETKVLNQAVKRNLSRFPEDFMFQLNEEEFVNLKSQFVTSSWGGRRTPPYAFTEQGVAMLSGVLNSQRAIEVNIAIMRTFVHLRKWMEENKSLAAKVRALEKKYDEKFHLVFQAIQQLIKEEEKPKKQIGFKIKRDQE
jgi:hypothetical protein